MATRDFLQPQFNLGQALLVAEQIRNARQQREEREFDLEQKQQEAKRQELFEEAQALKPQFGAEVMQGFEPEMRQQQMTDLEIQQSTAQAKRAQFELERDQAKSGRDDFKEMQAAELRESQLGFRVAHIATPENWQFVRQHAAQNGLELPEQYDPQAIEAIRAQSLAGMEMLSDPKLSTYTKQAAESLGIVDPFRAVKNSDVRALAGAKVQLDKGVDPLKVTSDLRKEFQAGPTYKSAEALATSHAKIRNATPNAAGDLALLFGFMKMLDPGSVVRESEFKNAETAQSIPEKIRGAWAKVRLGERLPATTRERYKEEADAVWNAQKGRYNRVAEQYRRIAKEAGVKPENVVLDIFGKQNMQKTAQPTENKQEAIDAVNARTDWSDEKKARVIAKIQGAQ